MLGKLLRIRRIVHCGEPDAVLSLLLEYGLRKEDLPPALGGAWDEGNFAGWLNRRLQLEQEREVEGQG